MKKILTVFILACLSCVVYAQDNVIDEIVWVVGDDAILRSDIESQRLYLQNEGQRFDGDPYCVLPEQMAIQKLFLNQAKIDSVEVSENQVIQETDAIKARLRQFTDDINSGKYEFSTLARLYSEDPESAKRGGELGFLGKTSLLPEFANVAFNLKDPKKISQIVQTEYGYHIIQLIEKRGDRINCRHILLKPKVSDKELNECMTRMDSLYNDLTAKKFTFEEAATFISADKDTRNNKGLMVNQNFESDNHSTPKFEMAELPQEIGKMVYTMQVGDISKPFTMINDKQKEVVAIVKLKARVDQHKANISDDYQALKSIVESRKREELLHDWIIKKQKSTYVRISDGWRNCDFQYPGWIKE